MSPAGAQRDPLSTPSGEDEDEATQLVLKESKASESEHFYDELLIPVLNNANRDHANDDLSDEDEQFVLHTIEDILQDLGERRLVDEQAKEADVGAETTVKTDQIRIRLLACPAREEADRLGLLMLQHLLDPAKWDVEITAVETLTSELVARVEQEKHTVVCIGSLPPGGLAQSRYLCKRLRAQFPRLKIIVGRWGLRGSTKETASNFNKPAPTKSERRSRKRTHNWTVCYRF